MQRIGLVCVFDIRRSRLSCRAEPVTERQNWRHTRRPPVARAFVKRIVDACVGTATDFTGSVFGARVMAYYTKVLQPGERVLAVGRLHWSIYRHALVMLAVALAVFIGSFWLPRPDWAAGARVAAGAIAAIGLLAFLGASIRRHGTEIVVTDRRVIFKRGILSRHTVEMNVSKIESVDVEQSFGARMLGYGTLLIHGTGSDIEPLQRLDRPLAIRSAIVAG
jgi:membrane protein YdbS with pleckstrin-like domain